jgi:transcriptional regulator with XRE-family HTH domain
MENANNGRARTGAHPAADASVELHGSRVRPDDYARSSRTGRGMDLVVTTAQSTTETARRIRAARTYACLSVAELAGRIGMGIQTVKRIEAGRRSVRRFEIWAIAEACGLPRAFFEMDFCELAERAAVSSAALTRIDQRLARIESRLDPA